MDYPIPPQPKIGDVSLWKKYFNPKTPLMNTTDFEKAAFATDASKWIMFWDLKTPAFQERLRPLMLHSLDNDDFDAWYESVVYNESKRILQVKTRNGATISDIGGAMSVDKVDTEALRLMVAQARTRGWKSIKASGTPEFMEALWVEAKRMGLDIDGYTHPNQAELAPQLRCEYYERTYAALEKRLAAVKDDDDKSRMLTPEYKMLLEDILSHKKAGGLFREKHPEIMEHLALIHKLDDCTPDNNMQEGEGPAPDADANDDAANTIQEGKAPPEVVSTTDDKPKTTPTPVAPSKGGVGPFSASMTAPTAKKPEPAAETTEPVEPAPEPAAGGEPIGIAQEGDGPKAQYAQTAAMSLSGQAKTMAESLGLNPQPKKASEEEIAAHVAVVADTAIPQTPAAQKKRRAGGFGKLDTSKMDDTLIERQPDENNDVTEVTPR